MNKHDILISVAVQYTIDESLLIDDIVADGFTSEFKSLPIGEIEQWIINYIDNKY